MYKTRYSVANVLNLTSKYHISPILRSFHWLPVEQRIGYKILLLAYKFLNGLGPLYPSDLLHSLFLLVNSALPLILVCFAFLPTA